MKKILAFLFAISLFYFVGAQSVLASSLFNVEVRTYLDGSNMNQAASGLVDQARGSKVQFNASGISSEYEFAFYAVNDIVRDDLPQNYEFVVRSNMKITAFFRPNGSVTPANARHVVIFADNNGKIIADGVQYVADGGTATEPSVLPNKPNATYATPKWFTPQGESSLENITSSRVYLLQYVSTDNTEYTVNVTGGSVVEASPYNYNDVITLQPNAAPAEQVFSHWEDAEGNVLSTKANYKFTVMGNASVQAVFAATPEFNSAVVNMSDALSIRSGYVTYKGQFDLPAGFTLVEYGFIFSRSSDVLTLDSLGATIVPSNVHNGETGEFLRSFPDDTFNSVRAYLIVKNVAQEEVIVYSDKYNRYPQGIETLSYQTGFINKSGSNSTEVTSIYEPYGDYDITWTGSKTYVETAESGINPVSIKFGSSSAKGIMTSPYVFSGLTKIELNIKLYGSDSNKVNVKIGKSGSSYVQVQQLSLVGSFEKYTISIDLSSLGFTSQDLLSIQIEANNASSNRFYLDDIKVYTQSSSASHEVVYNNATPTSENVLDGQLISNTAPIQTGYSFEGWYTDVALTQAYNVSTPVVQSLQLYAKWIINEYTITFNSDGGSSVSPITQNYNTAVVAPADPTREGYSFTGWSQAVPANMPANNLTLTAQWSINQYTITFDSNEGSAISAITQDFGTSVSAPLNPTREGYLFLGWFTDDNTFLNAYTFSTMPAESITVYAKWEEQVGTYFTVTFDSNGGSAIAPQQVLSGDYATEPTAPTRTGYTFVNWQDITNTEWDFANDPVIEAMTLYASWALNTYTLTFDNLLGTTQSNPTTYTVVTETITLVTPSAREGYNFIGWFTAIEGGSQVTEVTLGSTGNILLFARWSEIIVLSPITITLTESSIWSAKTDSYLLGSFEKNFSGMTIKSDDQGFYTGSTYGDNKIQVRKNYGWVYNTNIPEGYIIKSVTVNGQTSGLVNIYFSTTTAKPNTNVVSNVSTSGDVSSNNYLYFYIKENNTQSGTVTIDSIIIELIPNP
ncbi:InlB B-repeat-containing protein [Paracholeplasma manati]|uniref:InlB B-repeat-containing protein n=1 Tax=Paracholeplasma manati TaxID=591373 RepID=UPI002408098C|nr:InlB B-repeat-containing protein [Paracholeplasma manati]MDG0889488.1 InlB B-repeat-containing protein [Paracholeplasma manati]